MSAGKPKKVTEEVVMFYDTDCGAVVHNLAYLRMIERCRTLLAEDLGMPIASMGQDGVFPVLTRTEIDYRCPARLGDALEVVGWLAEVERVRFWCEFEVRRGEEVLITARQGLALVKMPEGRVQRLPESVAKWR